MTITVATTVFHYRAATADGKFMSGRLDAIDRSHAIGQLKQLGATPVRLDIKPLKDSWLHKDIGWSSSKSLSSRETAQICRELALLMGAGLELPDAIESVVAGDDDRSRPTRFLKAVLQALRMGKGFAAAVEQSGFKAPREVTPTLRAGESAGSVGPALQSLAETLERRNRLAGSVVNALIYPAFLLGVVGVVLAVLAGFVAPPLARLFVSMNRPPPLAIALLSEASDVASSNPALIALGFGGIVLIGAAVVSSGVGRAILERLGRATPVIGGLLIWSMTARFASALRLSLSTNVPTPLALEGALGTAGGIAERNASACVGSVRRGVRLQQALVETKFLPRKALHLIAIGESGGRLVECLQMVIEESGLQVARRASLIETLLGPLLIALVGVLVGSIVFSIFSALLEINSFAS
jgi:general secretion pathway protein F